METNDLVVRDATLDDLPSVAPLMKLTHDAHVEAFPHRYRPLSQEEIEDQLRLGLEGDGGFLVACEHEAVLGYAIFEIQEAKTSPLLVPRRFGYLFQIGVDPAARRRSVGKLLVEQVRRACEAAGVQELELDVWAFNDRARSFFESAGFEPYASKLWTRL